MDLNTNWKAIKEALVDGLDSRRKGIVGQLLENQKQYFMTETAAAGSVSAQDIAGFRKIIVPMIRRVIPGTIATEIVGVQPMQGPVGLVYTLRYQYTEAMTQDGASPFGGYNINPGDELFGNLVPIRQFYSGDAGTAQPAGASGLSQPIASEGDITSGPSTGDGWPATLSALDGCTVGGSGSFIEGSGGRKVTLEVLSQAVEANSRKLQAGWTIEAMQDLQAQHGLDLESELTQAMSAEIVQEIDAEIITDLLALAGTVATFDGGSPGAYTGPNYMPAYVGDRLANIAIMINYVGNEIARKTRRGAANFIVCSPMIVSVLQSASKSVFAPAVEGSFKGPNNTTLVGTLNGSIKVYSYLWDQAMSTDIGGTGNDVLLIGYKGGNGETDTGYFYCPYIPLMSSGVVMNPVTFQPVVSLMTRYGKAIFNNTATSLGNSRDYYGKLVISNMSFA